MTKKDVLICIKQRKKERKKERNKKTNKQTKWFYRFFNLLINSIKVIHVKFYNWLTAVLVISNKM